MEADVDVQQVMDKESNTVTTGHKHQYTHFYPKHKAKISKYAVKCCNTAATMHFSKEFPTLGKSAV